MKERLIKALFEDQIETFKENLKFIFMNYFNAEDLAQYSFFPSFFEFYLGSLNSQAIYKFYKFHTPGPLVYDSVTYVLMSKLNNSIACVITYNNYFQRDVNVEHETMRERHKISYPDVEWVTTDSITEQYNYDKDIKFPFIDLLQNIFDSDPQNIVELLAKEACYRSSSPFFNERLYNLLSTYKKIIYIGIANKGKQDISIVMSRNPEVFLKHNITQEKLKRKLINNLIAARHIGITNQTSYEVESKIKRERIDCFELPFSSNVINDLLEDRTFLETKDIFTDDLEIFMNAAYKNNTTVKIIDTEVILRAVFYVWFIVEGEEKNWELISLSNRFSNQKYYNIAILSKEAVKDTALILEIEGSTYRKNKSASEILSEQVGEFRYGIDIHSYENIKKIKWIGLRFNGTNVMIRYSTPALRLSQRVQTQVSQLLEKGKLQSFIRNLNFCLNEVNYQDIYKLNPDLILVFMLGMVGEWTLQNNINVYTISTNEKNFSFLINPKEINQLFILTNISTDHPNLQDILHSYQAKIDEINRTSEKKDIIFIHINRPSFIKAKIPINEFISLGHSFPIHSLQGSKFYSPKVHKILQNKNKLIPFREIIDELAMRKVDGTKLKSSYKENSLDNLFLELMKSKKMIYNKEENLSYYVLLWGSAVNNCDRYRIKINFNVNERFFSLRFIPKKSHVKKENNLINFHSLIFEFDLNPVIQDIDESTYKKFFWKHNQFHLTENSLITVFVSTRPLDTFVNSDSDSIQYPPPYWGEVLRSSSLLEDCLTSIASSLSKGHGCSDVDQLKSQYVVFSDDFIRSFHAFSALNEIEMHFLQNAQYKITERWIDRGADSKTVVRFRAQIRLLSEKIAKEADSPLIMKIIEKEQFLNNRPEHISKKNLQEWIYFFLTCYTIENSIILSNKKSDETVEVINDFLETIYDAFGQSYSNHTFKNLTLETQKLSKDQLFREIDVASLIYQAARSFSKLILLTENSVERYYWRGYEIQQLASLFSKKYSKINFSFSGADILVSTQIDSFFYEKLLNEYSQKLIFSKEDRWNIFWRRISYTNPFYSYFPPATSYVNLHSVYEIMKDILKNNEELQAIVFYPYLFKDSEKIIFEEIFNYLPRECRNIISDDKYTISEFSYPFKDIVEMNSNLLDLNTSNILSTTDHNVVIQGEKITANRIVGASDAIPVINWRDTEEGFAWSRVPMGDLVPLEKGKVCYEFQPIIRTSRGALCKVNSSSEKCRRALYFQNSGEPLVLVNVNRLNNQDKIVLYVNAPNFNEKFSLQGSLNNSGIFIVQSIPVTDKGNRVYYQGSKNFFNHFMLVGQPHGTLLGGDVDEDRIDAAHLLLDPEKGLVMNFVNSTLNYFYREINFSLSFSKIEQYFGHPNTTDRVITNCNTRLIDTRGNIFNNGSDRIEAGPISCAPYHFELRIVNSNDIHVADPFKRVAYRIEINRITSPAYLINFAEKDFKYPQTVFINADIQNITIKKVEKDDQLKTTNGNGYSILVDGKVLLISNLYDNLVFKMQGESQFSVIKTTMSDTIDQLQNELLYETLSKENSSELADWEEQAKFSNDLQLVMTQFITVGSNRSIYSVIKDIYYKYQSKAESLPVRQFTIVDEVRSETIVFGSPLRDEFLVSDGIFHLMGKNQNDYYKFLPLTSSDSLVNEVTINSEAELISNEQGIDLIDLSLFYDLDPIFKVLENDDFTTLDIEYVDYFENLPKRLLIRLLECKTLCEYLRFKIDDTKSLYHINHNTRGLSLVKMPINISTDSLEFSEMRLEIDRKFLNETSLLIPEVKVSETHHNSITHSIQKPKSMDSIELKNSNSYIFFLNPLLKQTCSYVKNFCFSSGILAIAGLLTATGIMYKRLRRAAVQPFINNHQEQQLPPSTVIIASLAASLMGNTEAACISDLSMNVRQKETQRAALNRESRQSLFTDSIEGSHPYVLENVNSQLLLVQWLSGIFKSQKFNHQKLESGCVNVKNPKYESILYDLESGRRKYAPVV